MRRSCLMLLAGALCACVSMAPLPDPLQAVAPKQRLVVLVFQSPGPWIISEPDSKAEAAAKVLPVGFLVQTVQDDRTLELSRDLQQYLPRPRYDRPLEDALLATLKTLHSGPVQTGLEAGITPLQLREWNAAKDQLDWRRRYFSPEYGAPAPRDYSKLLSLDDAVVLEVNLSFGTEAGDELVVRPALSTALRLYRANTARLLWNQEETLSQRTSSSTLSELRAQPAELTSALERLAPQLGESVARSLAKALGLTPPPPARGEAEAMPGMAPTALPYGLTPADVTDYGQSASSGTAISTGTISVPTDTITPPTGADSD